LCKNTARNVSDVWQRLFKEKEHTIREAMIDGNKVERELVPGKVSEMTGHGPHLTGMHGRMQIVADHRHFRVIQGLPLHNITEPWASMSIISVPFLLSL
jgi:hypothetical protein